MMDKDLHTPSAEAEFDQRCRTLLEGRSVAAPAPRADLFADAPAAGMSRKWAVAAGVALVATGLWWFSGEEAAGPLDFAPVMKTPAPEVQEAVTPDAPFLAPQPVAPAPGEEPASSIEPSSAIAEAPVEAIREPRVEDAPVPAPTTADEAGPVQGIPTATEADATVEEVESMDVTPEEVAPSPEDAVDPALENEGRPTLKLPLTLPSGGGHR